MITWEITTDRTTYHAAWQSVNGHFLHSWMWGEVKQPAWTPIRIVGRDEAANAVITIQILRRNLAANIIHLGYVPRLELPSTVTSEDWQRLVELVSSSNDLHFLLIEPSYPTTTLPSVLGNLQQFNYHVQPHHTNIISLKQSEADLHAKLRDAFKRQINKATKSGIQVTALSSGDNALNAFWAVMSGILERTRHSPHGKDYYAKIWSEFGAENLAQIFVVEKESNLLGAYFLLYDNHTAYELYGGLTPDGRELSVGPLLKWTCILDAKVRGLTDYDQWGIAPKLASGEFDSSHPLAGVSNFKAGFGGQEIEFAASRAVIFSPLHFQLFKLASRFRA